jgi:hypothetical protein
MARAPGQGVSGDLFTAGAALTPIGIVTLLGGLVGIGHPGIAALLISFSFSYLVLLLYVGLAGLGGVRSPVAAPAVPLMIVVAGWCTKVVFALLF